MAIKNIAVFVEPSRTGAARARYAVELARRHGAHLIGIFAAPPGWNADPTESFVRGTEAIPRLIERHKAAEIAISSAANQSFEAATKRADISFEFRIIREKDVDDAKLHSLYTDLIIVGAPRPGGLPNYWSVETLLLTTGVPFLMLPDAWKAGTIAERVLVAWNASREARRAVSDSLSLLMAAQSVSVVVVDPWADPRHGEEPGADIALYLSRHGVNVDVVQLKSQGQPIEAVILGHALRIDADLIVLGAYSHSRTREFIFGGVTRFLLQDSPLPLLIAH
ncbi:universal stress protein [uncultured Bradyrhizobium sp.]|uniref:universal stress protein n=1 Tax=Bradyrhizobium sp. TaxID=376 RepID=UPI002609F353|nr:universal stress protein [uncultured Bradyrhizobium sp.]